MSSPSQWPASVARVAQGTTEFRARPQAQRSGSMPGSEGPPPEGAAGGARFAGTKFHPPRLPAPLVRRPALRERLTAGASQRLTVVVGSAGAGKSVLLADWAAARTPGTTSWLSCDAADADPLRFWAGFIEAPRGVEPGFGADAAGLLAMDRRMSAG